MGRPVALVYGEIEKAMWLDGSRVIVQKGWAKIKKLLWKCVK